MNEMPASAPKAFASDVNSIFSSDAKLLLTSTLSHRSTENSVCWLLDGDDSRIRQVHAQHNLAVLRRMAFDLLPSANSAQIDIAAKRERAGWKTGYLLKILSQQDAIALPSPARFPAPAAHHNPTPEIFAMAKQKVILNPYPRPLDMIMSSQDADRLHDLVDVIWGKDEAIPESDFARACGEAFAIITTSWQRRSLDAMPNLRAIMETGGRHPSPDLLDYATCFARGIRVLSCAPAYGPMVAEMALGMAIAAARGIVSAHRDFVAGEEVYLYPSNSSAFTLYDQPVGFIGFGGLAQSLKPLLAPFRCPIQVYDPWLPASFINERGCTPVSLHDLLTSARVIFVLAIPSNENKAMLERELLSLIRSDAVLVLISRSHLVDFDALTDLLHQGRFRAAIDVFPQEPLAADHPIRTAPNTILSAHRAGTVWQDMHSIGRMVVDDLETMLAGLPPTKMQTAQPELVYRLP